MVRTTSEDYEITNYSRRVLAVSALSNENWRRQYDEANQPFPNFICWETVSAVTLVLGSPVLQKLIFASETQQLLTPARLWFIFSFGYQDDRDVD